MASTIFGDDALTLIYTLTNFIATIICSWASLIMIIIIYRMKSSSGHVLLLLWMSYFQLAYDLFSFTTNVNCGYYVTVLSYFEHLFTGTAVYVISNWMTFIAFYIVLYRVYLDVRTYTVSIFVTALVPGVTAALVYLVASVPESKKDSGLQHIAIVDITDNVRLASIGLNFLFIFIILYKISQTSSKGKVRTPEEKAIRTLAARMIFYPVVQAVSRSFYAWYEIEYGINRNFDNLTTEKYICLMLLSVSTPLVSVGYLIIFLIMQPRAYKHFKVLMCMEKEIDDGQSTTGLTRESVTLSALHQLRPSILTDSVSEQSSTIRPSQQSTPDFMSSIDGISTIRSDSSSMSNPLNAQVTRPSKMGRYSPNHHHTHSRDSIDDRPSSFIFDDIALEMRSSSSVSARPTMLLDILVIRETMNDTRMDEDLINIIAHNHSSQPMEEPGAIEIPTIKRNTFV